MAERNNFQVKPSQMSSNLKVKLGFVWVIFFSNTLISMDYLMTKIIYFVGNFIASATYVDSIHSPTDILHTFYTLSVTIIF